MITFDNKLEVDLPSLVATQLLASKIANGLLPGSIIFLHGDLGAGKTTLVRALLLALGHTGPVKSPTYTLVESYQLNALKIEHFDLYRLSDPSELEYIGIRDYITNSAVCIFEWPRKGEGHIPTADLEITLEFTKVGRKALIVANTALGKNIIENINLDNVNA